MVSMQKCVALLPSIFMVTVGAERIKIARELATSLTKTPAEQLQEIFQKKENLICGGKDIHNELTKDTTVGGMRTTNYELVKKIAEVYLEDLEAQIPQKKDEVRRLAAAAAEARASEAYKDAEEKDLEPLLMTAISQPKTFMAQGTAVKSKCGFRLAATNRDIAKENRLREAVARRQGTEPELLAQLDRKCWENTVGAFDEQLQGYLSKGKIRVTSKVVLGACCGLTGCVAGVDAPKSYCDELCVRLAGNPALNEVGFLGGSEKELRAKLDEASAELLKIVEERNACRGHQAALEKFRSQMEGLNGEIERTFRAQVDANDALAEAEDGLVELDVELEELGEEREALEQKLSQEQAVALGLSKDLATLKAEEPQIKEEFAAAVRGLGDALRTVDEATNALSSFNKLKVLVTSTIAKMWLYFEEAVLAPLNRLGLQKGMPLQDFFEKSYEQQAEYETLVEDLDDLTKHCEGSAKPAFRKVTDEGLRGTLLEMCDYTPVAESSTQFASQVLAIGDTMLANLKRAQDWHEPLKGHPELTREMLSELASAGEPAGLRNIEDAFSISSYFSSYLRRWKADGEFLKLLASLKAQLEQLKENGARLGQIKDDFAEKLQKHVALKRKTLKELRAAIKGQAQTEEDLAQKRDEENAQSDLIDKKELDIEHLRKLLEDAEKKYEAAVRVFEGTHKEGTNMVF